MIDTPIVPPSAAGGAGNNPPSGQQIILKIPEGLQNLTQGQLVEALVVRHDSHQHPLLRFTRESFQQGELPVASRTPLPQGSSVVLRVLNNNIFQVLQSTNSQVAPQFQAEIVTIDGKLPTISGVPVTAEQAIVKALLPVVLPQAGSAVPTGQAAGGTSPATVLAVSNGAIIDATVIKPEQGASSYLPQQAPASQEGYIPASSSGGAASTHAHSPLLQSYDVVKIHILSSKLPPQSGEATPSSAQQPPAGTGNQPLSTTSVAENTRHIAAYKNLEGGEGKSLQHSAEQFAARGGQVPSEGRPIVTPVTHNQAFTATVIGTEKSGEIILQTPLGTLKLPAGMHLPQGTQLVMESLAVQPGKIALTNENAANLPLFQVVRGDTVLEELTTLLKTLEAETGQALLPKVMAQAGSKQFAARLLWFLVNIQQGGTQDWLGKEGQSILKQYDKQELVPRIEKLFTSLRTLITESTPQGWNSILLPFYDGERYQQVWWHMHREHNKNKAKKDSDIRFLVELHPDQLGEMQIDGLVKRQHARKQVDIIVRTHATIPEAMQREMMAVFTTSLEITGTDGKLRFQTMETFPVHPLEGDDTRKSGGIFV